MKWVLQRAAKTAVYLDDWKVELSVHHLVAMKVASMVEQTALQKAGMLEEQLVVQSAHLMVEHSAVLLVANSAVSLVDLRGPRMVALMVDSTVAHLAVYWEYYLVVLLEHQTVAR